ncbi:MAG: outer membrane protein [Flavobacterium sp.]
MKLINFLLLFTAFSSFAQIRFEPGYFIDNAGTRQDVLIRNIDWKNSPTTFEYRPAEGTDTQERTISNTAEFSVGGNTYKRFDVKIDRSSSMVDKLSDSPAINWKSETLYLKRLVDGKLALYQYEDSNLVKYFYSEGSHSTATQLIFREYRQDGTIIRNTNYRQQLYSLMKDKYTDAQKFKSTKYTRNELTGLFEDYNGTAADDAKGSGGSGAFHLNVAAGATFSSMSTQALTSSYQHDFEDKAGFRAGVQLEYVFPFNRNKWSLLLDPNYQSYSSENTQGTNTFKAEYQRLEVPVMVRHYFYITDKSRIFLNGAYNLSFSLGDSYIQQNAAPPAKIDKNSSWALGAGFGYDRFTFEARYVFNHEIGEASYWLTDFSSAQLILAYRLF